MGKAILFFITILLSVSVGLVCGVICFYSKQSSKNRVKYQKVRKRPLFRLKCKKTSVEGSAPCLSKIDKSASYSDFTMDVDELDKKECSENLRKSQESKYKRTKQEG